MVGLLKSEKGIALFLVLWVLTLLSVIVGEFCFAMRTEVNITRNFKEQTEAYYIALAGLNRAIGELIRNEVIPQKAKSRDNKEGAEEEEEVRWRSNIDIPAVPFAQGRFVVNLQNEKGKININGANESMLEMMLQTFDLEEQEKNIIVDSIMDWRDKNNFHRLNGAEDDYYRSLPEPYDCKDGDFDSVEELLMVRGITPEIFYGGIKDMVTVYPRGNSSGGRKKSSRMKSSDTGKISINAASPEMLRSLPLMTDELVQEVIEYRKEADFGSLTEVSSVVGPEVYKAIAPYITLETSRFFTVISTGKLNEGNIAQGVEAVVEIDPKLKKKYRVIQWRDIMNAAVNGSQR